MVQYGIVKTMCDITSAMWSKSMVKERNGGNMICSINKLIICRMYKTYRLHREAYK